MKRALGIVLIATMASSVSAAPSLVAGWENFVGSDGFVPTQLDADTTATVSSIATNNNNWGHWFREGQSASADGSFGNMPGASASTEISSPTNALTLNRSDGTLIFTLTNNSGEDRVMNGFYFDCVSKFANSAKDWELSISGAISGASSNGPATQVNGGFGAATPEQRDHVVDLTGITDNVWEAGQDIVFTLAFTGSANTGAGGGNELLVDNIAVAIDVEAPPSILLDPQDTQVVLGADQAEFSVVVAGSTPLSYQWSFGGTNLVGATNETLTILNPDADDLGDYAVFVSNSLGSTNSASATLSYLSGPITPGDRAAVEGAVVTYGVDLPQAATNYTYQWNFNGGAMGTETNELLVFDPVAPSNAGVYTVDVTFDGVTETSDPVTLLVAAAAVNDYATTVSNDNPLAWWRLGELSGSNALDSAGSAGGPYDGIYEAGVQLDQPAAPLGESDRSARFTGTEGSKINKAYTPDLNPPGAFSVEAWALVEQGSTGQRNILTSLEDVSNNEQYGYELVITAFNNVRFSTGRFAPGSTSAVGAQVVPGEWMHLVGVYDGTSNTLYVNGFPVDSVEVTSFEPVSGPPFDVPLYIGAGGSELDPNGNSFFEGLIDEVAIYSSALSQADVLEHYAAALPADAPPQFSQEPTDEFRDIGGQVTFDVSVRATGEPTFQWQKDGIDIPGATNTSVTLTDLELTDAGAYRVLADVAGNVVTSGVGNLTLRPPSTVLLENFESYAAGLFGPVASTNDWLLDDTVQTNLWTVEVEGTNQYLRLVSETDNVNRTGALNMGDGDRKATATNGVPSQGISTVFMRFYYESGVTNGLWWGSIDGPGTGFGAFRGSVSSRQTTPPGLSVRGPSSSTILSTNLAYDTWYNMWQVHDNDSDTMQVYLTTGNSHATTNDRFEVNGEFAFGFRMDSAGDVSVNPLNYYQFLTRSEGAGFRVDDIYISTGISLVNPVALPELDPLGISLQGGSPEITWTDSGTLQSTDDLEGDVWTDLPTATSPYTPPAGPGNESFRLRGN